VILPPSPPYKNPNFPPPTRKSPSLPPPPPPPENPPMEVAARGQRALAGFTRSSLFSRAK